MKKGRVDLSIVVPCYNEEEAIPLFFDAVTAVVGQMGVSHEFVFVDDGSSDGTLGILKNLAKAHPQVRYVSFSRNFAPVITIFSCSTS